jgi:hypothetical protein
MTPRLRRPSTPSITSSEGAITLIWAPNAEPDIAGYLVLRGEAGDATLTPVTDTVVTETRFTESNGEAGRSLCLCRAGD